jgi:hypothetical protein
MPVMRPNSGVRDTAAWGLFLLPLGRPGRRGGGGPLLGVRFGLAGRFFCVAAHDLLDADRERAPLLGADQGQHEEGQPWHRLAIQTGKEPIQAMGVFACFGGHNFIARQQVDVIRTVDMLTKEHPKQHGPRERLGEKALDGPVTAAWARPAGDAQHRHTSRHDQHRHSNAAELTQRCPRDGGLEALQTC